MNNKSTLLLTGISGLNPIPVRAFAGPAHEDIMITDFDPSDEHTQVAHSPFPPVPVVLPMPLLRHRQKPTGLTMQELKWTFAEMEYLCRAAKSRRDPLLPRRREMVKRALFRVFSVAAAFGFGLVLVFL